MFLSDSPTADWWGDRATRRSVSASVICLNEHVLATSSRTQKSLSLSSCGSEFNAYVSGMCDLIYVHSALKFILDEEIERHTCLDSSAARGLLARVGFGRVRHLSGKFLRVQDLNRAKCMSVSPIETLKNGADIDAKSLSHERILCLLYLLHTQSVRDLHGVSEKGVPFSGVPFRDSILFGV